MELARPGVWTFDRRVHDRRLARSGCVHGELRITERPDGQDWAETGTLSWAGSATPISRNLQLRRQGAGWWMLFADGRSFHPWLPGTEVVHACGADVYRGYISLGTGPDGQPRMRTAWDVIGPAKDQLLVTRLRLLG